MAQVKLYTAREVAAMKGITVRQVQRLTKAGALEVHSFGPRNTAYYQAKNVRYMPLTLRGL